MHEMRCGWSTQVWCRHEPGARLSSCWQWPALSSPHRLRLATSRPSRNVIPEISRTKSRSISGLLESARRCNLATRAFDCQRLEPVDPDDEICVWGPITLAALHDDPTGPPFIPGVPLVTKFAAPESFDGEITTLVASGRSDGVVLVAGIGETELIVSEITTDGSALTTARGVLI